jgi:hypothetical protein
LIDIWQRLVSRKTPWSFAALGKVIKKRGRFMAFYSSGDVRWVAVICLTLSSAAMFVAGGVSPPS